jgi:hypothetical protein
MVRIEKPKPKPQPQTPGYARQLALAIERRRQQAKRGARRGR